MSFTVLLLCTCALTILPVESEDTCPAACSNQAQMMKRELSDDIKEAKDTLQRQIDSVLQKNKILEDRLDGVEKRNAILSRKVKGQAKRIAQLEDMKPKQNKSGSAADEICDACRKICSVPTTRECRICIQVQCKLLGLEVCGEPGSRVPTQCIKKKCYENDDRAFSVETPDYVKCFDEEGRIQEDMNCCWIGE